MLEEAIHNCCQISLERSEPMPGSVKLVKTWLLLEYDAPMGAHALEESDVPDVVKGHLAEALQTLPDSRLLLFKSWDARTDRKINFSIVNNRELDPYCISYALESYDDLVDIDLSVAGQIGSNGGRVVREPFFLVCTNGKRDPCCAQMGLPVYGALQSIDETRVWQSSHVGGHRFAANVLEFPHGIYYGRVQPEDASRLFKACDSGELLPDLYRGRACYEKVVQAGESFLRRETGDLGLENFLFESLQKQGKNRWTVSFKDSHAARDYVLTLEQHLSEEIDFVSCRDDKQSPMVEYRLVDYQID